MSGVVVAVVMQYPSPIQGISINFGLERKLANINTKAASVKILVHTTNWQQMARAHTIPPPAGPDADGSNGRPMNALEFKQPPRNPCSPVGRTKEKSRRDRRFILLNKALCLLGNVVVGQRERERARERGEARPRLGLVATSNRRRMIDLDPTCCRPGPHVSSGPLIPSIQFNPLIDIKTIP